jgi:hypothetical protein
VGGLIEGLDTARGRREVISNAGVGALFRGLARRSVRFRSFAVVQAGQAVAE